MLQHRKHHTDQHRRKRRLSKHVEPRAALRLSRRRRHNLCEFGVRLLDGLLL